VRPERVREERESVCERECVRSRRYNETQETARESMVSQALVVSRGREQTLRVIENHTTCSEQWPCC
jgi:hypothetical protein